MRLRDEGKFKLEEQRIGVMYWNLFKRSVAGMWDGLFPRGLRRSSALPVLIVVAVVGLPGLGYYLHVRGKFATMKREIKGEDQKPAVNMAARPGGLEPVVLSRAQTAGSNMPEFRSVTLLPGLGMGVLQITASLPDKGEVPLLVAPAVVEATAAKTDVQETRGAIELPWAGMLTGLLSPVGTAIRANWHGKVIGAPTTIQGQSLAYGGILGMVSADQSEGGEGLESPSATAVFRGTDFNEHWVSRTGVKVTARLEARALELTVVATNVGDQPEPMGIGWHPRLLVQSGDRRNVELRLPGGDSFEIGERGKNLPSGRIVAAGPETARFQMRPAALGAEALEASVVRPRAALLDTGVTAEMRDLGSGVGLKMTAVSSSIHVVEASSPAGANYVTLGMQTNYEDPLGKQWQAAEGQAISTLMPGQSMEWKIRLEIYPITKK